MIVSLVPGGDVHLRKIARAEASSPIKVLP